jgi:DDE superfamily endonuclease
MLWCDSGYAHRRSDVLQAPYYHCRGYQHLPEDKRRFNVRMAKVRVSAEWMFKDITNTWRLLKFRDGLMVRKQPVGMFYIVGCDLTNIRTCLRGYSQSSLYFECPPPTVDEYLAPRGDHPGEQDVVVPNAVEPPNAIIVEEEGAVADGQRAAAFDADVMDEALDAVVAAPDEVVAGFLNYEGQLNLRAVRDWAAARNAQPNTASV